MSDDGASPRRATNEVARPGLHHVALGTRDVERLASFYRELLGVPWLRRQDDAHGRLRSIWLELAGTVLMIEQTEVEPGGERPPQAGVGLGPFLLAFRAVAGERASFEARALELGQVVESRSDYSSYLRDPDGNRIAFSEYAISHDPELG